MHERKLNRLHGFDYSSEGAYFVTICVHNRECFFGNIADEKFVANQFGEIIENQWQWLFVQYPYIKIDEFVIMPNHFHGIIHIIGNGRDRSLRIKPIPQLIGAFKTTSSKLIRQSGYIGFQWQKSYHDRIIRNDRELIRIRQYIQNNPQNWPHDADCIEES